MKIKEAVNILKPENNTEEALKAAYRQMCKTYHPDINPGGLEIMKVINAAYEFLKQNLGNWTVAENLDMDNDSIAEIFDDILSKIQGIPGISAEVCGTWLYVTGDTRPAKDVFKAIGMKWSHKKTAWYWYPEGSKSRRKGQNWEMDRIREVWGSVNVEMKRANRPAIA